MTPLTLSLVVVSATLFTLCDSLSKVQAGRKHGKLTHRFAWIALSILVFTACDILSKFWGLTMSIWPLLGIIISTQAAYFLFGRVTRDIGLAIGSSVINAGNVVLSMICGIIFFIGVEDSLYSAVHGNALCNHRYLFDDVYRCPC